MATVKKPAAKKAAKPVKPATKKPLAVKTAEAKVDLAKAVVKQVAATENLKAVNAKIKASKPAAKVIKAAVKPTTVAPRKTAESVEKKPAVKKVATIKKPVVVKKEAKKIAKIDKLTKVPAPAPLTPAQKAGASVSSAALLMRQRQFADASNRLATRPAAELPVEKFERPAPAAASDDGLSFKERLRQAANNRINARQAFLNRLQAAQRD